MVKSSDMLVKQIVHSVRLTYVNAFSVFKSKIFIKAYFFFLNSSLSCFSVIALLLLEFNHTATFGKHLRSRAYPSSLVLSLYCSLWELMLCAISEVKLTLRSLSDRPLSKPPWTGLKWIHSGTYCGLS